MKAAADKLNRYAEMLEDGQIKIREIVKIAYFMREPKENTKIKIISVIEKATNEVSIPRLKADAQKSLWNFAESQRRIWSGMSLSPVTVVYLGIYAAHGFAPDKIIEDNLSRTGLYKTQATGVPLNEYYKDVWEKRVKPTLDKLAEGVALDPNDYSGRNSLRNLAEMEVRYQGHLDSIEALKAAGVKLVVCSSHSDCSGRCAKWQGRIYSLDGTYGTVDGHRYVPLEIATDVYYTTKAGRTYKNGLLGFNCRHHLEPYRGQLLPTISAEERKKRICHYAPTA